VSLKLTSLFRSWQDRLTVPIEITLPKTRQSRMVSALRIVKDVPGRWHEGVSEWKRGFLAISILSVRLSMNVGHSPSVHKQTQILFRGGSLGLDPGHAAP
jgi:hypothetical protein